MDKYYEKVINDGLNELKKDKEKLLSKIKNISDFDDQESKKDIIDLGRTNVVIKIFEHIKEEAKKLKEEESK